MPDEEQPHAEREQTDESLRVEREKSDAAVAQQLAEAEARSVELLERAQADAELDAAREKADDRHAEQSPPSTSAVQVADARASEDASLRVERATEDEALAAREQESARAIAKLLLLERDKTDRDLLTERARSDEALAHRDDFLGIVSHDLRNLICGITMTAEITAAHSIDDEAWRAAVVGARQIQTYAARMNRLVRDLQDVASIDSGRLAMSPMLGDTTPMLREIVESFAPMAAQKRITIESDFAGVEWADFDHQRILQVLTNLVSNAIKFTDEGGTIRISRHRVDGALRFAVRDTGMGVAAEDHERIFDRFWQVGKDDRRGYGLGLYIAKCIVEQHGGKIWAKGERHKGTEIFFMLPAPPDGT